MLIVIMKILFVIMIIIGAVGLFRRTNECTNKWARWITVVTILVAIFSIVLIENKAKASKQRSKNSVALLLARTCVAEIGLRKSSTVEECVLMWSINFRNAEKKGWTLRKQTKKFNGFWKSGEQRRQRPWIKYLKDGPWKPFAWNHKEVIDKKTKRRWLVKVSGAKWPIYENRWVSFLEAAKTFVKNLPHVAYQLCPEAIDYGAPHEMPRSENTEPTRCLGGLKDHGGITLQRYWTRDE